MSAYKFVHSGPNSTNFFFVQRLKDRTRQTHLNLVTIFIGSRDIRTQSRKLS